MQEIQIVKNYRDNTPLRNSFNELAKKTFGLDFEDWYQNGYWGEKYNPYSVVLDGKIVANVSVNRTDFLWNGVKKHFIQLGTVMTDASYRKRGLIRRIMHEVETDYGERVDGMYLFANDSVLDFYPKFGFREAKEFQYHKKLTDLADASGEGIVQSSAVQNGVLRSNMVQSNMVQGNMVQVPMRDRAVWESLEKAIRSSVPYGNPEMVENPELLMFYVTKFMQENVYYDKNNDTYVIAEAEEGKLFLHNIFSRQQRSIDEVIKAFGRDIQEATLGFTPIESNGFTVSELKEEDTTLFIKGRGFAEFEECRVMIPTLAHA